MKPEDLAKQIAENLRREQMTHSAPPEPKTPTQRFRAMAQGLTFGGADEAEAYLRSKLTGEDYDAALADVRGKLEQYKKDRPWESFGYEVGGAALPAIAASVFTGGSGGAATGAKFFPTLAKLMGYGAAEGAAYAFGTGEGGFGERMSRVPLGAAGGAGSAGIGYTAGRAVTRTAGDFMDYVSRKIDGRASKRVERELAQIVEDSGMTMDEVIDRVGRGELMAEMSPMLRSVARDYYARSRGAAQLLSDKFKRRPDDLRAQTMSYLQNTLTGQGDDNVLRTVRQGNRAVRSAAGKEYDDVFRAAGPLSDDFVDELKFALSRVPEAGNDVKKIYRAQTGKAPFFEIDDAGNVTFNRAPTLEDAEIVRRGINTATGREYRAGAGGVGSAYGDVESGLRTAIDDISKPLAAVREKWSGIERASEAFEEGRKALSRSPDEVAIAFEEATKKGDNVVRAFRAGVVDAFRRKGSTGSRKSLPRNMLDENTKEGALLRTIFPEDNLDELLGMAQRATNAQDASNKILGGSETAVSRGRAAQSGGDMVSDMVEVGMGNSFAAVRLASQALKALRPSLNDAELQRIASLMVESNPQVLQRALTDSTAIAQVNALAQDILARTATASGYLGGAAAVPAADAALR